MVQPAKQGQMRLGQVVGTKVGSQVKVRPRGGEQTFTAEVARDLPVANNDLVIISLIGSKWYVIQRILSSAPGPPNSNSDKFGRSPRYELEKGDDTFNPVDTRTWNGSKWRTDTTDVFQGTYAGAVNVGCMFFGDQLKSLKGNTITRALLLSIERLPYSGGSYAAATSTLWKVTQKKRPSGAPTRTSSTTGPAMAVGAILPSFEIPESWVTDMTNGTVGGLAFYDADGNPDMRFAGMGTYSPALSLYVEWERLNPI